MLYAAVNDPTGFDRELVRSDLVTLRISPTDIIDHCIPQVARMLGEDWVNDRLSFARVSVASVRLYALCKSSGQEWDNLRMGGDCRTLLLATIDREDHIIGPAVLADQLRRRGHSVRLQSNATGASLAQLVARDNFDGVLISVATRDGLETAAKAIRELRLSGSDTVIALGGAVLNEDGIDKSKTGADVTTNDIDEALDAMSLDELSLRVAE